MNFKSSVHCQVDNVRVTAIFSYIVSPQEEYARAILFVFRNGLDHIEITEPKTFTVGESGLSTKYPSEYGSYKTAKHRCTNPKYPGYEHYGGRGIEFRFTTFKEFIGHIGTRPANLTLDRENNDGHYEVGNVRWVTQGINNSNQRPRRKKNRA